VLPLAAQRFAKPPARLFHENEPMPDYLLWSKALLVAAVVAAAFQLILAWCWRSSLGSRLGWVLGLGAGFYAGCVVLDLWPRWPIQEDRDRFLVVLLPLTLAIEIVTVFPSMPRWLAWLLRLALAVAAAPILLRNSVYLADLAGPHSAEWSPAQAALILVLLASLLAAVWILLALLQARTSSQAGASALTLSALAASVTVMLSGYLGGGLLGLPLAGCLAGATLASFAAPSSSNTSHSLGVGLIGLFGVLLIGRFFGSLPTSAALCLGLAPLLAWLPEGPGLRQLWPSIRVVMCLVFVAVPLLFVVTNAQKKFEKESAANSSSYDPYGP
jgi:hypothetical protein